MPQIKIDYSAPLARLIALHNQLAAERGKLGIGKHANRCDVVQRLAILRTMKPIPPPAPVRPKKKREQPIRDAILKALTFVDYYENAVTGERVSKYTSRRNTVYSVGLSYSEVLARVRAQFPDARTSEADLRWNANQTRVKLPDIRPRS